MTDERKKLLAAINYILILADTPLDQQKLTEFESWDSLTVMELVALAARYHVQLSTERVSGCDTVADYVRLIETGPKMAAPWQKEA